MHVEVMKPPCGSRAEQGVFEGLKPDVKTWQSYSLGTNSGSSKPWVLSSSSGCLAVNMRRWDNTDSEFSQGGTRASLVHSSCVTKITSSHNNVTYLVHCDGISPVCSTVSKLVTYLGLVPPTTVFRTLGGKPSLFGSSGRCLELHGLSG